MSLRRAAHVARLEREPFDVLVIGGGATGAGVALDAASRGLRVALVERDDFAAGTSSRSTKLVHGGVRYLEAAVKKLDRAQFHLVREALAERAILLRVAPHLVQPLKTVVPATDWRELLLLRVGLWLYDRAAGAAGIRPSTWVSRRALRTAFPRLRAHHGIGGVAYWDGQFDDARMAITLLLSAVRAGAVIANRAAVTGLCESAGALTGARLHDRLGQRRFTVSARVVINATGPGSDAVRRLEDVRAVPLLAPSRGTHVALDASWTPATAGLLVPRTADGRVLFLLPWQGRTIAGTTDVAAAPDSAAEPTDVEIDYLLRQLAQWLDPAPTRADIRASWAGLRPLIAAGSGNGAGTTANLVREHHITVGPKGLVTIAGGKWTTYRLMAEEAVDRALAVGGLHAARGCTTAHLALVGAAGYHPGLAAQLATAHGLDADVAQHLAHAYGDRAAALLEGAGGTGKRRLLPDWPCLEAEVRWAREEEMACTSEDVLARRLRLAFLDRDACRAARARVQALLDAGSRHPLSQISKK